MFVTSKKEKKMKIQIVFTLLLTVCISAYADLDRGNFGPFERSLNVTSHGYQVCEDTTHSAPTEMIEIFEVRPGDCSAHKTWDDCAQDRERSELSGSKDNFIGDAYWYGWSLYFPQDYPNIYPAKTALGQFHQKNAHPIWMFQNSSGGYHLDQKIHGPTVKYYPLLSEEELRGKWHKIEVYARWAKDDSGFFKVWVNGVQKVDYAGQTMSAEHVYFKYGVYRSFISRYKSQFGVDALPSQKVFYANVKRAKYRHELLESKKNPH